MLEVDGDLTRAGGEDLLDHLGEILWRLHPDERRVLVARALANDHFCKMKHLSTFFIGACVLTDEHEIRNIFNQKSCITFKKHSRRT